MGPLRADLLKKELAIFTYKDLLYHYPFRHVDKTKVSTINSITPDTEYIQISGKLLNLGIIGDRRNKRMVGQFKDKTGSIELAWFQGVTWLQKSISAGEQYLIYGRVSYYQGKPQIVHPEMEKLNDANQNNRSFLEPIYPTTEKLRAKSLSGRQIGKLTSAMFQVIKEKDLPENLPARMVRSLKFPSRYQSLLQIHFPKNLKEYEQAVRRLKFEELFFSQLNIARVRSLRQKQLQGAVFNNVGVFFNKFFKEKLPFELTAAQKRVIKEIRIDTASGKQMNRLLQGDVGSGKTIVALLIMLIAADNGYQSCLMAPTEILAKQHYDNLVALIGDLGVTIKLLTGSTKAAERKILHKTLIDGTTHILIGTHAVIEETVQFRKLGLAIIDEQHRFGVAQRARMWVKSEIPPHVLVMTATPIPRTLAMTAYGDLDYSVINELPPGRQPITTVHRYETARQAVMDFIRSEIAKGRQAYIIFPLIEESEKLDYENLMQGYEQVKGWFPEPKYWISMVHGKQPSKQKEINMQRFISGDTQIMVSTTVIEVGVNVPNATVMLIESAEKFGLSQLHQLRGRVGRGAEKSYCVMLTASGIGVDARERMKTLCSTNDGFLIAEKDLELRGPGEIEGTRQSGVLNFRLASIVQDRDILETARNLATEIINKDPELRSAENLPLRNYLQAEKNKTVWGRIS